MHCAIGCRQRSGFTGSTARGAAHIREVDSREPGKAPDARAGASALYSLFVGRCGSGLAVRAGWSTADLGSISGQVCVVQARRLLVLCFNLWRISSMPSRAVASGEAAGLGNPLDKIRLTWARWSIPRSECQRCDDLWSSATPGRKCLTRRRDPLRPAAIIPPR